MKVLKGDGFRRLVRAVRAALPLMTRLATIAGSELVQRRAEIEHVDLPRRCTGGVFHETPNHQ